MFEDLVGQVNRDVSLIIAGVFALLFALMFLEVWLRMRETRRR